MTFISVSDMKSVLGSYFSFKRLVSILFQHQIRTNTVVLQPVLCQIEVHCTPGINQDCYMQNLFGFDIFVYYLSKLTDLLQLPVALSICAIEAVKT